MNKKGKLACHVEKTDIKGSSEFNGRDRSGAEPLSEFCQQYQDNSIHEPVEELCHKTITDPATVGSDSCGSAS